MSRGRRGKRVSTEETPAVLPVDCRVSAVVTVLNEEATLPLVLRELGKLPLEEIVVVLNGCTDSSLSIARSFPQVTAVHYAEKLGHDVGRSIGAKLTKSDIVLFVDSDIPIGADRLKRFIAAIAQGADVALNDISPFLPLFRDWDEVTKMKAFLNLSLGRPDLRANSMTCVPHAMSRRAIERIGSGMLAVPPKAQAAVIEAGLRIRTAAAVNVLQTNRVRNSNVGKDNEVSRLIIGDHIEALKYAMNAGGSRLTNDDSGRRRHVVMRRQL
ncbi:glycosyl transferase family 2 [Paenibacillus cellulosilyticus]|uniref:Glycosyl transferase family 2 n=1 Tax=Paenibacillus cellulosilyticus TaxID=375489 RepID=A0A2V2YZ01_9BACL|nr:glycosyltransferase family A protein [Paenibacillus cellulosilyticus]PWW07359.1 glycosyl transferase family 2 [Paenibacillus cellulosilyticus]